MAKEIYTMGTWQVKPGKEDEFVSEWEDFAKGSIRLQDGASEARLLRDITKDGRYASFGMWENTEYIGKWRESPIFKKFMAKAKELCEDINVRTYEVVVHATK